jgi:hypothetical protein
MSMPEAALSVAMLAAFIWVLAWLLPRARREHDTFALVCALLTALVALVAFLFIGIGTR